MSGQRRSSAGTRSAQYPSQLELKSHDFMNKTEATEFINPPGWRRQALVAFALAGLVMGMYLLYFPIEYPVTQSPCTCSRQPS
jgi:hypothetical protein